MAKFTITCADGTKETIEAHGIMNTGGYNTTGGSPLYFFDYQRQFKFPVDESVLEEQKVKKESQKLSQPMKEFDEYDYDDYTATTADYDPYAYPVQVIVSVFNAGEWKRCVQVAE